MRLRSTRLSYMQQGSGRSPKSLSWAIDADGNWSLGLNWGSSGYYPKGNSDVATFGSIITANRIVTLTEPIPVNSIIFSNDFNYTLAASGGLLNMSGSAPSISNLGTGSPTISCPVVLLADTSISCLASTFISGGISGSFGLTKTGSSPLVISGSNTFSGAVNINAGGISCGSSNALPSSVAIITANTSGVSFSLSGSNQLVGSIAGGGATGGGILLGSNTLTIGGSATTTFSGAISGVGGSIALTGAAVLILAGTNTLSGSITCSATGNIRAASTTAFGTATIVLVNGSTFSKSAGALTNANVNPMTCSGVISLNCNDATNWTFGSGAISLAADTEFNVPISGSTFTSSGVVNGSNLYSITKTGLGTLSLGGTTPVTNYVNLNILNGTVTMANSNSLPSTMVFLGDTSGSNSATLSFVAGFNKPVTVRSGSSGVKTMQRGSGSPTLSGAITLQTDLTLNGGSGNVTLTGGTLGTGNLLYTNGGSGTFSINTTNLNHAGNFTTSGTSTGTITQTPALGSNITNLVHGAPSLYLCNGVNLNTGTVSVNAGTFGGTGTSKGAMTVASGATLRGGTGDTNAGTLTSNGNVTLNSGAISRHGIGSTTTVSSVAVTGNLTFNGNTVNFPASALNAGTYTLYTYTGSQSGTLTMGTLPTGRTFSSFSYSAGSVTVTFT